MRAESSLLIARDREVRILEDAYNDSRSHFIAVYGRRRIGKTFLVRETFGSRLTFSHSGLSAGKLSKQLEAFQESLEDAGLPSGECPKSWMEAFRLLKRLIRGSDDAKKVIFIDELSWMDTPRCDLMMALENFWNGWASARKDIVLIICASATSWMISHVIHNKGGLYNRLTDQIALEPFCLGECEEYLRARDIEMDRYEILEGYMILGGVPYYWEQIEKGKSMAQNIDSLFFARKAKLKNEFDYLYASLFRKPDDYIRIVTALATKKAGMLRAELAAAAGISPNGTFTRKLEELENCGFIRKYHEYGRQNRDATIQLIDNFTLFYFKFIRSGRSDANFQVHSLDSPERKAWEGLAFERVCLQHLPQILSALGISGMLTDACAWHCRADPDKGVNGSQVDLLIVRRDRVINLCEMKYSTSEFAVTKSYDEVLRRKLSDFTLLSKVRYAVHMTLVTTYGLTRNAYSGHIQSCVTAKDLFRICE